MRRLAALLLLLASPAHAVSFWDDGQTFWDQVGAMWDMPTPTPASTGTPTRTQTPTQTSSDDTPTPTQTHTFTSSPTSTPTGTLSTPTVTPTYTASQTTAPTNSPTRTMTFTNTPTGTLVPTGTATPTRTPTATFTPAACCGDCNGGGSVSLGEVQICTDIFLGNSALSTCFACDCDSGGTVTIDEVQEASLNNLNGCPVATATVPSATPSITPTASPSPAGGECVIGGTSTPYLMLCKPPHGYEDWDIPLNLNSDIIDDFAAGLAQAQLPEPTINGQIPFADSTLDYTTGDLYFQDGQLAVNQAPSADTYSFDFTGGTALNRFLRLGSTSQNVCPPFPCVFNDNVPLFIGQEVSTTGQATLGRWGASVNSKPTQLTTVPLLPATTSMGWQLDPSFFRVRGTLVPLGIDTTWTTMFKCQPNGSGQCGVFTDSPQSALQVPDGRYLQASDNNAGAPAAEDCDSDLERGRISHDTSNNRLYFCAGATRGWDYAALTD